ncbi:MAG: hypothetical protein AAGA85_22175, partial [Bacteroidota bacterium]
MTKEEFFVLLDRYEKGEASEEEKALFESFFDSMQMQKDRSKDWDLTYKEQVKLEIYGKVQSAVNPIATAPTKRKVPIREIALASVIAVSSFLFLLTYVNRGTSTKFVTKRAEAGQHATINLSDGSSVKLNAGSSITYPQAFDDDIPHATLRA